MDAFDVAAVVVRLAIGTWLMWSLPRLPRRGSDTSDPSSVRRVSVVIPARDEEHALPVLLGSVPDHVEVVVVDDGSADATAAVAVAHGARLLPGAPLPPGWTGKSWACAQGYAASTGDLVVFVDADVRFASGGLPRVVDALEQCGGLVSVQPFHEPGGPVEHLAALVNVVSIAGTDAASPLGRRRGARGAFGPVLATRRRDYERAGGHEAVRSSVVDDVALAERYRAVGSPVTVFGGGDAVSFRMYPHGLGQLIEGFTKNLAAGVGSIRRATAVLVVAWMTLLVQAAAAPVVAVVDGDWATAIALYLVVALQAWWMARRVGRFGPVTALAHPLLTATFLAVFARSVLATASGSVSWRGRRVSTRAR